MSTTGVVVSGRDVCTVSRSVASSKSSSHPLELPRYSLGESSAAGSITPFPYLLRFPSALVALVFGNVVSEGVPNATRVTLIVRSG
jgi:hypothetical protein